MLEEAQKSYRESFEVRTLHEQEKEEALRDIAYLESFHAAEESLAPPRQRLAEALKNLEDDNMWLQEYLQSIYDNTRLIDEVNKQEEAERSQGVDEAVLHEADVFRTF